MKYLMCKYQNRYHILRIKYVDPVYLVAFPDVYIVTFFQDKVANTQKFESNALKGSLSQTQLCMICET